MTASVIDQMKNAALEQIAEARGSAAITAAARARYEWIVREQLNPTPWDMLTKDVQGYYRQNVRAWFRAQDKKAGMR